MLDSTGGLLYYTMGFVFKRYVVLRGATIFKVDMMKIAEEIKNSGILSKIPKTIHGFSLSLEQEGSLNRHIFFAYANKRIRRMFLAGYDKSTKEYLGRIAIGLHEFCAVDFIAASLDEFERLLDERLEKTLLLLGTFDKHYLGKEFLQKKILEWPYAEKLPGEISGFELFISPHEPVKVINGSYVILDYSDFELKSGLIIYYNIFRDEFFGELKMRCAPAMTTAFDAKTLPELEEKLNLHLKDVVESLKE